MEKGLARACEEYPELLLNYQKMQVNVAAHFFDTYVPVEIVRECKWYWGKTGSGKTRKALAELGGDWSKIYMKPNSKWFDGYR